MALSANTTRAVAGADSLAIQVVNSAVIYSGGFAGLRGPSHATSQGDVAAYSDEAGMIFLGGHFAAGETGDGTSAVEGRVNVADKVYRRIAVTGASAQTDVGSPVYATDDDTLTLTRPTTGEIVGHVSEWHTGTTCDVFVHSLGSRLAANSITEFVNLGTIVYSATGLADGDIMTSLPMMYHGEIVALYGMDNEPLVGASGTSTVNLEIGTTDLTGGVLTVSTAAGGTLGTLLSATAITGNNVFHEGDTISVEASSTSGTLTSGFVTLIAEIQRRPGA